METFSALLALCAGNSPVTREFPTQKSVTRSFDAVFDLCLNKRLSKQSWDWWFETPSHSLWRHCNGSVTFRLLRKGVPSQAGILVNWIEHSNTILRIFNYLAFTVYPKKYAHGFCFAVLCCGYTLTDFPISIRLTSLALWQSNDCPSASTATLMNMDKYFMRIHYERLHNHNKAKHNKTVCIFLGIYCISFNCTGLESSCIKCRFTNLVNLF